MELTDILSVEEWVRFEKELSDRFQLNCTVYKTDGISVTGKQNFCNNLCPKIKANKDALAAICAPGNQYFMAQAKQTRKAVIDECDAGLLKIAVPIFVGEEFMGTAGGCGVLLEGGEVEEFMVQKTTGFSEDEIATLCQGLGSMAEDQAHEVARAIEERISQVMKRDGEMDEVKRFLDEWTDDSLGMKPVFQFLYDRFQEKTGVRYEWIARPGVSYSFRATHENQTDRPLFVMLDVIDDDPHQRWLSVCFYGDMITDPDEQGDLIPGGLLGSDGYCFDVSEQDDALREYVGDRIQEAYEKASKS